MAWYIRQQGAGSRWPVQVSARTSGVTCTAADDIPWSLRWKGELGTWGRVGTALVGMAAESVSPRGHPEPWRSSDPCVLLVFLTDLSGWVGRLLGGFLPTNDCIKADSIQIFGNRVTVELYVEAAVSAAPLAVSRAMGKEIPPFQWTAWKWSSPVECSSLGKFFL